MTELPGEDPLAPGEDAPFRAKITFCVRDLIRKGNDRNDRRKLLLEAFDIVKMPIGHHPLELATAQCLIRAMIESGCDWRHITEGATTALSLMRFADEERPQGGIIVTS